jgi:hypothetical protein
MKLLGVVVSFIIIIPTAILSYKLSIYLLDNDFKSWWTSIMWVLIFPTTLIVFIQFKRR